MVGIKNFSTSRVSCMHDGNPYDFEPKEVRMVHPHVGQHLIKVTYACAISGSPLRLVPDSDIPAEILESGAEVSPTVSILKNTGDSVVTTMHDGAQYSIEPGATAVFPVRIANFLIGQRSSLGKNDLVLEVPVAATPPTAEVPADVSTEEIKVVEKKSVWRKKVK